MEREEEEDNNQVVVINEANQENEESIFNGNMLNIVLVLARLIPKNFRVIPTDSSMQIDRLNNLRDNILRNSTQTVRDYLDPMLIKVAEAGFTYVRKTKCIGLVCLYCEFQTSLERMLTSDPFAVHAEASPKCIYPWAHSIDKADDISSDEDASNKCIACCVRIKQIAFLPCNHMSMCAMCAIRNGERCPNCRNKVYGLMRIYHA